MQGEWVEQSAVDISIKRMDDKIHIGCITFLLIRQEALYGHRSFKGRGICIMMYNDRYMRPQVI